MIAFVMFWSATDAQMLFSLNSGVGRYNMADLKAYQLTLRDNLPVNAQITSSFPAFWYYEVSADFLFDDDASFGLNMSRGSTGGRVDYTDYSGSIGNTQLLSYFSLGGSFGMVAPLSGRRLKMQVLLKPTFSSTSLLLRDYLVLGSNEQTNTTYYRSASLYLQPTLNVAVRFGRMGLNASAGYNISLKSDRLKSVNSHRTPLTNDGRDLQADWSGIRVGAGVSFFLFKEKLSRNREGYDHVSAGIGLGLDYGGLGVSILSYPNRYVGAFLGIGLTPVGFGLNGGLKLRHVRDGMKVNPHLMVMYGYNAVIMVVNAKKLNKIFYGTTIGVGMDIKQGPNASNYWTVGIGLPVRGPEVDNYLSDLRSTYGVVVKRGLLPLTLSVGYRFALEL